MNLQLVRCAVLTSMLAFATAAPAAVPNMKEGLWEMAAKTETPGTPGNVSTQTAQRCMSTKDLKDPRKMAPESGRGSTQCEVTNYRSQANTASWNMTCKGSEPMTATGSATYDAERYTGVNRMSVKQGGQTVQMTMNYIGRYLGPCQPGEK